MSHLGQLNSKVTFMSRLKVAMTEALSRVKYFALSMKYNQDHINSSTPLDSMISKGLCPPLSKVDPIDDTFVPESP